MTLSIASENEMLGTISDAELSCKVAGMDLQVGPFFFSACHGSGMGMTMFNFVFFFSDPRLRGVKGSS